MNPPKTQAELDAEAKEAEEKAAKEKQSSLNWIFEKIGGLFSSGGSIIMMLLVAIAGFALVSSDKGKEILSTIGEKIVDVVNKIQPGWGDKLGRVFGGGGRTGRNAEQNDV